MAMVSEQSLTSDKALASDNVALHCLMKYTSFFFRSSCYFGGKGFCQQNASGEYFPIDWRKFPNRCICIQFSISNWQLFQVATVVLPSKMWSSSLPRSFSTAAMQQFVLLQAHCCANGNHCDCGNHAKATVNSNHIAINEIEQQLALVFPAKLSL